MQVQLRAQLGDEADLCFSAYDCLEVLPLGCNKGTALDRLSRHLGLTMADCMAFGDAMNDKEMLGAVGHGVVMGNALPQLKSRCRSYRLSAIASNRRWPTITTLAAFTLPHLFPEE